MAHEILPEEHVEPCEEILIKKVVVDRFKMKCTTISLNKANKTPFHRSILPIANVQNFEFGSVIEISENGRWSKRYDYHAHKYDCVSVLDKFADKVVVFGNKTGEISIKIDDMPINIERGDLLLLDTHNNTIIHNITRARIIRETQKLQAMCNTR